MPSNSLAIILLTITADITPGHNVVVFLTTLIAVVLTSAVVLKSALLALKSALKSALLALVVSSHIFLARCGCCGCGRERSLQGRHHDFPSPTAPHPHTTAHSTPCVKSAIWKALKGKRRWLRTKPIIFSMKSIIVSTNPSFSVHNPSFLLSNHLQQLQHLIDLRRIAVIDRRDDPSVEIIISNTSFTIFNANFIILNPQFIICDAEFIILNTNSPRACRCNELLQFVEAAIASNL